MLFWRNFITSGYERAGFHCFELLKPARQHCPFPTITIPWIAHIFFHSRLFCEAPVSRSREKTDLNAIFYDFFAYFRLFSVFLGPTASWNPFFQIPRKILRGFMYFQPFSAIRNDVLMLKWRNIMEKYQPPPPPWRRWAVKIGRYLVFIYAMISAVS